MAEPVDDGLGMASFGKGFAVAQLAFLIGYIPVVLMWAYSEWLGFSFKWGSDVDVSHEKPSMTDNFIVLSTKEDNDDGGGKGGGTGMVDVNGGSREDRQALLPGDDIPTSRPVPPSSIVDVDSLNIPPGSFEVSGSPGTLRRRFCAERVGHLQNIGILNARNRTYLLEHRSTLRASAEFGALMLYYFACDRTSLFGQSEKVYNRDLFLFIYFLLILVAGGTSLNRHVTPSLSSNKCVQYLNRHQTEEWKGWMQVLFLMYHYFHAAEIYNAIRIFIACYVWMTGFGNFSYYYIRKDFSLGRFSQMMWRLNFLVIFCCVVLQNDYMLYYICPMHTLFTLMVYISLAVYSRYNEVRKFMAFKFICVTLVVVVVWEVPGVFETVWWPLTCIMKYRDPNHPDLPLLHEWHFRSGLDRYIWIVGMLYAYFHPNVERWLEKLDEMETKRRVIVRTIVCAIATTVGVLWYQHIYCLEKWTYNKYHPYTSWIPISAYIVLRNISPTLRHYSLDLFGWLGKITLETYIGQFHIWLRTAIPNGQPKWLLCFFGAGKYPLLNFMLSTIIYTVVSKRLFDLTNTLKNAFVPAKDNRKLLKHLAVGVAVVVALFAAALSLSEANRYLSVLDRSG